MSDGSAVTGTAQNPSGGGVSNEMVKRDYRNRRALQRSKADNNHDLFDRLIA